MQRHKAQSCKQLSNRHSQEDKSHMEEHSQIASSPHHCKDTSIHSRPVNAAFQQRSLVCWFVVRERCCLQTEDSEGARTSTDSSSSCVSSQRPCAPLYFVTAPTRTASVWASARTSARSLGMRPNTGLSLSSPGEPRRKKTIVLKKLKIERQITEKNSADTRTNSPLI